MTHCHQSHVTAPLLHVSTSFPKTQNKTAKFEAPERWHESASTMNTHSSGMTFEPHYYMALSARCMWTDTHFLSTGKNAIITLKVLGVSVQNSVAQATWRPVFVHPSVTGIRIWRSKTASIKARQWTRSWVIHIDLPSIFQRPNLILPYYFLPVLRSAPQEVSHNYSVSRLSLSTPATWPAPHILPYPPQRLTSASLKQCDRDTQQFYAKHNGLTVSYLCEFDLIRLDCVRFPYRVRSVISLALHKQAQSHTA
jgi:hypothetical protein